MKVGAGAGAGAKSEKNGERRGSLLALLYQDAGTTAQDNTLALGDSSSDDDDDAADPAM